MIIIGVGLLVAGIVVGFYLAGGDAGRVSSGPTTLTKEAQAASKPPLSPVKPLAKHDVYYPGTEALGPNEMRVIACGTGVPNVRPKQAAACWLVELGNGDKFFFD